MEHHILVRDHSWRKQAFALRTGSWV